MKPGNTSNDVKKYFSHTRCNSLLTAYLNLTSSCVTFCVITTNINILSSDDIKSSNNRMSKRIFETKSLELTKYQTHIN